MSLDNHKNHENHIIRLENQDIHENFGIPYGNNENH